MVKNCSLSGPCSWPVEEWRVEPTLCLLFWYLCLLSHNRETSLKFGVLSTLTFPVTKNKNIVRQGSGHAHGFWTPFVRDDVKCDCSLSPLKLRKLDDAIDDCTNAVKLDDTYIKAYLRRAQW